MPKGREGRPLDDILSRPRIELLFGHDFGLICWYSGFSTNPASGMICRGANMEMHSMAASPQVLSLFREHPEEIGGGRTIETEEDLQQRMNHLATAFDASSNQQLYPSPLAEHEALLANHTYFYDLFNSFHAALGTRLTVPKMGDRELDLHLMYREVTACGGLEQVIKERRWKEVTTALKVPSSIPNPSFVLRKHYINLLYHFEQVHYFGAQGRLAPPPGPLPAPLPAVNSMDDEIAYQVPSDPKHTTKRRKKRTDPAQLFGVDPGALVGQIVTGAVNCKFDNGYLVTMVVGSEKLKGVLYHVSTESTIQQYAAVPGLIGSVGSGSSELDALGFEVQVTKKRRERMTKRDPGAPRPTRNGYNFFYVEQRARLKKIYAQTDREISRMVIDLWKSLSDNEKMPYIEQSQQDKERYKTEMMAYKERLKLQACSEGYNGSDTPEAVGKQIEGQVIAPYFHDGSYDYHVSLDAETDMNSFHIHQQQGIPSDIMSIPVAAHEVYSGEGDSHVYTVRFPQVQLPESHIGRSSFLPQTYEVSNGRCSYQTQSNVCQPGLEPYSMSSEQVYWMQEGGQSYSIQEDGHTLNLYPQNPFG